MGISVLAIVLLGPIVQPWYLMWSIAILAITAGPRTAVAIVLLSVAVSLLGVVGLGQLSAEIASLGLLYQILFTLTLAASIVVPIRRMGRRRDPEAVFGYSGPWSLARAWNVQGA